MPFLQLPYDGIHLGFFGTSATMLSVYSISSQAQAWIRIHNYHLQICQCKTQHPGLSGQKSCSCHLSGTTHTSFLFIFNLFFPSVAVGIIHSYRKEMEACYLTSSFGKIGTGFLKKKHIITYVYTTRFKTKENIKIATLSTFIPRGVFPNKY